MTPDRRRSLIADLTAAAQLIERMAQPGAHHAEMVVKSLRYHVAQLREVEQSTQVFRRGE